MSCFQVCTAFSESDIEETDTQTILLESLEFSDTNVLELKNCDYQDILGNVSKNKNKCER